MTDLLKLTSLCQNLECEYILNALMKDYTTFQIGGPCDILVRPYDEGQVAALIQFCAVNGIRWQVIGNGSNLLAPGRRGIRRSNSNWFQFFLYPKIFERGRNHLRGGRFPVCGGGFCPKRGAHRIGICLGNPGKRRRRAVHERRGLRR